MEDEARVDDGLVFFVHGLRDGKEIGFVALIMFIGLERSCRLVSRFRTSHAAILLG